MARRERDILDRSVHAIAEQAANTNRVIDEATEAGLAADHPVTVAAKQVRLELLKVKADLERELGNWVLDCKSCGVEVHWVQASACRTRATGDTDSRHRMETRSSNRALGTQSQPLLRGRPRHGDGRTFTAPLR